MPIRRSGKSSSRWSRRLSRRCSRRQSAGRGRRTRALLPRGTKPPKLKPSKGAIRTAAGFRFTRSELIVKIKSRKRKQKKCSLRVSKSRALWETWRADRSQNWGKSIKANVNSLRNQILSLKKKVSRMQIEADAEPNFLIRILNNVQDTNASNPSQSAGKYLTNGEGAI